MSLHPPSGTRGAEFPRGNRHVRAWNHDLIVDAIQRWATETGAPPASSDWNPARGRLMAQSALAKARAWHERIQRFEAGSYPSVNTVRQEFGSFSAALEAAGIASRPSGRTPRTLTDKQVAALKRHDAPGTSAQLAASLRAVHGAQQAKDTDALRSALFDLAAVAMAWCERLADQERVAA